MQKLISFCPQSNLYWDKLTILDHMYLFSSLKPNMNKKKIIQILKSINLWGKRHVYPYMLSGGMKRRLSVAICALGQPQISFFDEPTNGLDPINQKHVINLIKEMSQNSIVFLTSHNMEEIEELSDKIVFLKHGKVFVIGSSAEIKFELKLNEKIIIYNMGQSDYELLNTRF